MSEIAHGGCPGDFEIRPSDNFTLGFGLDGLRCFFGRSF